MKSLLILITILITMGCNKKNSETNTLNEAYANITLKELNNNKIQLSKALNNRQSILIFYRGGWCPYCNKHLKDLKNIEKDLQDLGYQIIAISPEKASELAKTKDGLSLPYTLLSDSQLNAAKHFDLAFTVDSETLKKYSKYGIDLEKSSGEKHHGLPVPSVLIISKKGEIVFKHSDKNYKKRLSSKEILEVAKNNI